ncbi:MAG: DUF6108 family protein [Bacteroidaceae bacterium]|nr:DUF6108 family protein [Bacteroidaceae bacterium]
MRRLMLPLLLLCCIIARAQSDCHIEPLFVKYAVQDNATEVLMSGKALKAYRLRLFHSLEIRMPGDAEVADIERSVRSDARTAICHEQNEQDGRLLYGLYELKSKKKYAYIFYRYTPARVTLIYLQGPATVEELRAFFKK